MTPGEENHNETDWQSVYQKVEKFCSKLKNIEKRREEGKKAKDTIQKRTKKDTRYPILLYDCGALQ